MNLERGFYWWVFLLLCITDSLRVNKRSRPCDKYCLSFYTVRGLYGFIPNNTKDSKLLPLSCSFLKCNWNAVFNGWTFIVVWTSWSSVMAQEVKCLLYKSANLSLIPQTYRKAEGENKLHKTILWPPRELCSRPLLNNNKPSKNKDKWASCH